MRLRFLYQLVAVIFSFHTLSPVGAKEVAIAGTQDVTLYSQKVDHQYRLLINLPMGFDKNNSYPVIYLLDAQWDFPLISATYGQLYFDGLVPAAVIVGITWGGEGDDPNVERVRDFSPSKTRLDVESGGADNFLAFIKSELIPYVQQEYSGNEQRVLMGSSLGGLFTLYALFNEPQLFSGYIPTASASGWDNEVVYSYAKTNDTQLRKHLAEQPIKLYSAVGELDNLKRDFSKLQAFFARQQYSGLHLKTEVLANLGHAAVKAPGNAWGLQFIFKKPDIKLTARQLTQWTGTYQQVENDEKLSVVVNQGQLVLLRNDQTISDFHAASNNDFYLNGQLYRLTFAQHDKGTTLQIDTFGQSERFKKVSH